MTLVRQQNDQFLGHIAPPVKDAVTILEAFWEFIVENGYDGVLEAIGGDSTATNTSHKGGIICLLTCLAYLVIHPLKRYRKVAIFNEIIKILTMNVKKYLIDTC